MKTKTKKKVVSGLLGMLLAVVCFIPMSFSSAKAEGNTIATTSLFTARPETQTGSQQGTVSFVPATDLGVGTGLKVNKVASGDTRGGQKWYYDVNGTFMGDGAIEYVFTENTDMQEAVSFICSDLEGNRVFTFFVLPKSHMDKSNNYLGGLFLESEYKKGNDYSAYVFHGDTEVNASTVTLTKGDKRSNDTEGTRALMKALGNGVLPKFGELSKLFLDFTETNLAIKGNTEFGEQTLLTLEYETHPEVQAIADNGYKIRIANGDNRQWNFSYNWASQPPSILSINGVALSGETVALSQETAVAYDGEYVKDNANYIDLVQGSDLQTFAVENISYVGATGFGKVVTSVETGEPITYEESFASKAAGVYDITVSGKDYKVNVLPAMDTTNLVTKKTSSNAELEEMSVQTKAGVTGLWADDNTAHGRWTYSLNTTFYGDSRIDFADVRNQHSGYTFAISDLSGNRVLDYHIGVYTTGGVAGYSIAFVKVASENWNVFTLDKNGAQKRLQLTPGTDYQGSINKDDRTALQESQVFLPKTIDYNETYDATPGYFGLTFTDNGVAVIASTSFGEKEVATLPFATYTDLQALENGYTIQLLAYTDGTGQTMILGDGWRARIPMLLAINGVALDQNKLEVSVADEISYEGEYVEDGKNYIELEKGDELAAFDVVTNNTLVQDTDINGTVVYKATSTVNASELFASKEVGEYNLTVASANGTKNYTVRVYSHGKVLSANLTLSDDIVVNYSVSLDAGCTEPKATVTFNGGNTVVEEYEVVDGKYVFSFEGVTPQYLHKDIDISVTATYDGQPQVVCEKKGFSVRDYCEGMLAKSATDLAMTATKYAALQTLLVDLLNYGAAAQTAESVDVDDLANKNLSNEQKALATPYAKPQGKYVKSAGEYAADVKAASLYLDRKVIIAFAIDCGNLDAQALTVKVLAGGKTYTYTAADFTAVEVGGVACQEVRFGSTLATDFDREIKVQVFNGNEAVSAEVTYSVNSFIARKENDLMKSLYSYGVAAAAYVVAQ